MLSFKVFKENTINKRKTIIPFLRYNTGQIHQYKQLHTYLADTSKIRKARMSLELTYNHRYTFTITSEFLPHSDTAQGI